MNWHSLRSSSISPSSMEFGGIYVSPPLVLTLSRLNPLYTLTCCFFKTHLFLCLCLHLSDVLISSDFSTKILYALFVFTMRSTCPNHFLLLYLIPVIIPGDEYKLWMTSIHNFLHRVRYFLSSTSKYLPRRSVTRHCTFFPCGERQSFTPIQRNCEVIIMCINFRVLNLCLSNFELCVWAWKTFTWNL
jgi:hypothetical protein